MKKTVLLAISALMILSSCQQDDINETSSSDDLVSFTFHYHGESYKLEFLDDGHPLVRKRVLETNKGALAKLDPPDPETDRRILRSRSVF